MNIENSEITIRDLLQKNMQFLHNNNETPVDCDFFSDAPFADYPLGDADPLDAIIGSQEYENFKDDPQYVNNTGV